MVPSLTYYESLVTIQGQISEFIDSRFFEPILLNLEAVLFINHGFSLARYYFVVTDALKENNLEDNLCNV